MAEKAFIVEAVRTAGGKRDGRLSLWPVSYTHLTLPTNDLV